MKAQNLTNTTPNRYPDVFRTLRARVEQVRGPDLGQGDLRILSFGCSIGFRDCIFEKSADAAPLDLAFLQAEAPSGVAFGAPIVGEGMDAEGAAREGIIAAHREEAFGSDADGRLWMRAEWRKATLAKTVTGSRGTASSVPSGHGS